MPDCEAVTLWRKRFKLNLSSSWKADVEKTVTDLDLWKEILDGWFYLKDGKKFTKHPGIKGLLDEYERLARRKEDRNTAAVSARSHSRVSERSHREMQEVWSHPPSEYFRARRMV